MRAPDPPFPPPVAAEVAAMDPRLAELAGAVRDARPALEPRAASRLDARIGRALAPRAPVRRRRPLRELLLVPGLALAVCACVAVLVVLGVRGGEGIGAGSAGSGSSSGGSSGAASSAADGALAAPSSSAGGSGSRAVEQTTTLELATARGDVDHAATAAAQVATGLGGYVAASTVTSRQVATLQLQVPGERLDQAVARLSRLGHVRAMERSAVDITDETTAARHRVAELRAERRSLLGRLARAPSARAADRLRGELARTTRRLDRARRAAAGLHARAALASISVTIEGERRDPAAAGGRWTPGDALRDAGRVLQVAAGVAIVALAVLVPLAAVAAVCLLLTRRAGRRRLERGLDAA
jgi:uncharacterized protein DUF4349